MKIFVIVYGLLGLVPIQENPGNIMALLVDPYGMHMSDGMPAEKHYPEIGVFSVDPDDPPNTIPDQILGLAGDDVEIPDLVQGALDPPIDAVTGYERILRFSEILKVLNLKPRGNPGCIG